MPVTFFTLGSWRVRIAAINAVADVKSFSEGGKPEWGFRINTDDGNGYTPRYATEDEAVANRSLLLAAMDEGV